MKILFHLKISKIGQREAEICQKMWEKTQNQTFCYHSQLWSAGEEKAGNVIQLQMLSSSRYDGIYMRGTTSKMPQSVAGFGMLVFGLLCDGWMDRLTNQLTSLPTNQQIQ